MQHLLLIVIANTITVINRRPWSTKDNNVATAMQQQLQQDKNVRRAEKIQKGEKIQNSERIQKGEQIDKVQRAAD